MWVNIEAQPGAPPGAAEEPAGGGASVPSVLQRIHDTGNGSDHSTETDSDEHLSGTQLLPEASVSIQRECIFCLLEYTELNSHAHTDLCRSLPGVPSPRSLPTCEKIEKTVGHRMIK